VGAGSVGRGRCWPHPGTVAALGAGLQKGLTWGLSTTSLSRARVSPSYEFTSLSPLKVDGRLKKKLSANLMVKKYNIIGEEQGYTILFHITRSEKVKNEKKFTHVGHYIFKIFTTKIQPGERIFW